MKTLPASPSIESIVSLLNSNDAAVILTLPAGPYTAQVRGANDTTGVALSEVYDLP